MKQVFISHSSKDKEMAEVIYNYLTNQGIKCWIDFHDIRPRIAYAREIMRGIDGSDALVVIYSKNVNSSVEASDAQITILKRKNMPANI